MRYFVFFYMTGNHIKTTYGSICVVNKDGGFPNLQELRGHAAEKAGTTTENTSITDWKEMTQSDFRDFTGDPDA